MNDRLKSADLLKGIAVLLMIQIHIIELFASQQIAESGAGKILFFLGGPWVAPVFAFFLGYFLFISKKNFSRLIVRGILLFVLGMILNLLLNANLIYKVNNGSLKVDLIPYIFGVDILQFAGLATVIIAIIKQLRGKELWVAFLIMILSACLGHYLLKFNVESRKLKCISSFFCGSTKWSYFPLFPWLAYPLLGFIYGGISDKINTLLMSNKTKYVLVVLFILFFWFTIKYAVSVSANLGSYYHHGIIFFLWTVIFLLLYVSLAFQWKGLIGQNIVVKYIKWLGKNVTLMYCIQWIIIGNYATAIYKTITSPLYLVTSFCVITIAVSCLAVVFLYIKNNLFKAS